MISTQFACYSAQMAEKISYRGPDDWGWLDEVANALAHVACLSSICRAGHQPMLSE
jgi:asparagine synthetase B (glutamine-hydrolysing)